MKQKTDLSIIIVNFNTSALLDSCLASIYKFSDLNLKTEIIVVDNASSDTSVEMVRRKYPEVMLIENSGNDGYAKANNLGLRKSTGRYLLLLNSDTEVYEDSLTGMVQFMNDHSDAGAATCSIRLPDGTLDPACHRGLPTPWVSFTYLAKLERLFPHSRLFGEYHQGYKDLSTVHEVDCISGAFFLIRRQVLDEVGYLDEDYFMYGEDIDWSYRIRKKGWIILYNPNFQILHKKKQSGRAHSDKQRKIKTEIYFHTYNWLFYKKNFASRYGPVMNTLVHLVYTTRLFLLKRFSL